MQRVNLVLLSLLALAACDEQPGAPESNQGKFYVVRPGENLFAIAEREYGNGMLWPEIRRANPWVRPYKLQPDEPIYIPTLDVRWEPNARKRADGLNPTRPPTAPPLASDPPPASVAVQDEFGDDTGEAPVAHANPASFGTFSNVISDVSSKKVFGMPAMQAIVFCFCGLLSHSLLQSVLVWLATIFTFLKETSFKKSMKAVFLTETLTFATILTVGALGILMLYLGSPEELSRSDRLFPTVEDYINTRQGMAVAIAALLLIYGVLSIRFFPQVLGVKRGQALPVVILAVLLPHMLGLYFIGQRLGFIPQY